MDFPEIYIYIPPESKLSGCLCVVVACLMQQYKHWTIVVVCKRANVIACSPQCTSL